MDNQYEQQGEQMIIEYCKAPEGLLLREQGGRWPAKLYVADCENLTQYLHGIFAGLDLVGEKVEEFIEVAYGPD